MTDHILKAATHRIDLSGGLLDPRVDRYLTIEPSGGGINFIIKDGRGEPLANAFLDHKKAKGLICAAVEMLGGKVSGSGL